MVKEVAVVGLPKASVSHWIISIIYAGWMGKVGLKKWVSVLGSGEIHVDGDHAERKHIANIVGRNVMDFYNIKYYL